MTQKNRFTPGPWRVFGKMTGKVISENGPGMVEICETGDFRDAELVPFNAKRWNADAHLIAAAPDMLEALRWYAEGMCEGFCSDYPSADYYETAMDFDCAGCKARAAIARATGEKP